MVRIVMLMMLVGLAHVNGEANTTTDDSNTANATTTTTTTTLKKASSSATAGGSSTSGTTTGGSSTSGTSTSTTSGSSTSSTSSTGGSSTSGTSTGGSSTGGGTTTKPATKTVFKSELTIAMSDPAKFVNSTSAINIVTESIAESSQAIQKSFVKVTALTVTGGRRLSVIARRLATSVSAKFTVTFPADHKTPVYWSAVMPDADKLVAAMNTKAKAAGINVTVTAVSVKPPEAVSGGTTTTTPKASAPDRSGGKVTGSPSVRHFLSIGITTIAIMSLMFGK